MNRIEFSSAPSPAGTRVYPQDHPPRRGIKRIGVDSGVLMLQRQGVPRWLKNCIGLLLLPFCYGTAAALVEGLKQAGPAETVWIPLLAGATCWGVLYLLLPPPLWLYVLGHELTHAAAVWLAGGRVKGLRVSARGGQVWVSKSNFLIALAPYFIPFYSLGVLGVFLAGGWWWNWGPENPWLHLLLGFTYAFHLTCTVHALASPQSDLAAHGYLFSFPVIWLGNTLLLALGLALLAAPVEVGSVLQSSLAEAGALWSWFTEFLLKRGSA